MDAELDNLSSLLESISTELSNLRTSIGDTFNDDDHDGDDHSRIRTGISAIRGRLDAALGEIRSVSGSL